MVDRRALPLALLSADEEGTVEGRTRFQKLVFLLQKECNGIGSEYDFKPHNYGPYSEDLSQDLKIMGREGYIDIVEEKTFNGSKKYIYNLTDKGRDYFEDILRDAPDAHSCLTDYAEEIENRYNDEELFDLLDYVYDRYPKMAVNSTL